MFHGKTCIFTASETELAFVTGTEPLQGGGRSLTERTLSWEWVDLCYRACLLLSGGLALGKWLNLSDPQYLHL